MAHKSWDTLSKPRRYPIEEYLQWKSNGGVTTLPPIFSPAALTAQERTANNHVSYVERFGKNDQLLMFFPYRRQVSTVPIFKDISHLDTEHHPSRVFSMRPFWADADTDFEAVFTLLARDINFDAARSASDGSLPFAKKRTINRSNVFAYHPESDTFHALAEPAPMQKTGVPAKRSEYRFKDAPANAWVIYDAMTKRVQLVADAYTAHYDLDTKFGDSSRFATLSKRDFVALLLRIKAENGKILTRRSNGETLFIGTKAEALRFINFTADGKPRATPTAFLRTLIVEDFK